MHPFSHGVKKGFHQFADTMAFVVNSVLLTIVYVIGVGPTSILAKVRGKHFMHLKAEQKSSYWEPYEQRKSENYYRMW